MSNMKKRYGNKIIIIIIIIMVMGDDDDDDDYTIQNKLRTNFENAQTF